MNNDKKYRYSCYADAIMNGAGAFFAAFLAAQSITKWTGGLNEKSLESYDDTMMLLGVCFILSLSCVFIISVYRKYLREREPVDGYYWLTFKEAYNGAKNGRKYESTNGFVIEIGSDGIPMIHKEGGEVSGADFNLAVQAYWRRIKEESHDDP